jgi:hypothetical protein
VCALMAESTVRLGQDLRECVLESGTARVIEVPSLPQSGKADHQVNRGVKGVKCPEGMCLLGKSQ